MDGRSEGDENGEVEEGKEELRRKLKRGRMGIKRRRERKVGGAGRLRPSEAGLLSRRLPSQGRKGRRTVGGARASWTHKNR